MSRMLENSMTLGDYYDEVPELDALERELVLYEIDDDWIAHYSGDAGAAWEQMYPYNQPEMDRLSIEVRKETLEAERYERERRTIDLDDALFDIGESQWLPALARRQAN